MDSFSLSINQLSTAIDNFKVGVTVYDGGSYYEPLKRIEGVFKLRRSKALLESAYKEQHLASDNFSSFTLENPRLLKREKIKNECQQLATQGMVSSSVLQFMTNSWKLHEDTVTNTGNEGKVRSKLYEFILELSRDSQASFGERYSDLLSAEQAMFDEEYRFQEIYMDIKRRKEKETNSISSDIKAKLSMAQTGLDKVNFMRRLIILLVGAKDVDLSKNKTIANIVLNRCKQLNLLDEVLK